MSLSLPQNIINTVNIVITNTDNIITFVSESYAKLIGYDVDEILGSKPLKFRFPGVNSILPWNWDKVFWENLNKNNHWNGILKNSKKNGEAIYLNVDIYKNFTDGIHTGYHAVYTDITHTILKPHKFILENELSKILFSKDEITAFCLYGVGDENKRQKIIEISEGLEHIIGINNYEFKNNTIEFTEIISAKSKYSNNLDLLMDDISKKNQDVTIELEDTVSGKIKTFKISLTQSKFDDSHIIVQIFRLVDVSPEVNYTNKINELLKSKNKFLAHISHEIKTPLNAMSGFISLLQLSEKNKEKRDYLNIISENTQHLIDLSSDIIELSEIDNNELKIVPREFTTKDIQSTIEIFFAKCLEKNIELTIYISPQLPDLMYQDIIRIKQIYSNLISNALKFVGSGGQISIDVHHHRGILYFTIEDNGIGLTQAQIEKIFNPYTQASDDTKFFYGGTGLGLSLVKEIVEIMGGSITVESEPNVGTVFSVTTPITILKNKKIEGKFNVKKIYVYAPDFKNSGIDILKKYLIHFTSAKIDIITDIKKIKNINDSCILLNYSDFPHAKEIIALSTNNKILLIKKINDVIHGFDNIPTITDISLPILGSKLYNALDLLLTGTMNQKYGINSLDFKIYGKVLVADDLESNRTLIKELLSKYDIELDVVSDGTHALSLFKSNALNEKTPYDLIFLDINMQYMDGFKTAAEIRLFEKDHNIERTALVALTANKYAVNDKKLVDMDEYLPKPINLKHLLSLIIKYTTNNPAISVDYDKFTILKQIRDDFMVGGNSIKLLLENASYKLNVDEFNKLIQIKDLNGDKRRFNIIYNDLMKSIRKNC